MLRRPLFLFIICLAVLSSYPQEKPKAESSGAIAERPVPKISADLGECTALFTVTNTKLKPIYNAKIEVEVRYGFGGFRRTSLEIYTNTDGLARVEGLPGQSKRPLAFTVTYEGRKTVVVVDVEEKCNGTYKAILTDKPMKSDEEDAE
jgi:hypothetical protein